MYRHKHITTSRAQIACEIATPEKKKRCERYSNINGVKFCQQMKRYESRKCVCVFAGRLYFITREKSTVLAHQKWRLKPMVMMGKKGDIESDSV